MIEEIIIARHINLIYFTIGLLIGLLVLALTISYKNSLALKLFAFGFLLNTGIEITALVTGHRTYHCSAVVAPFVVAIMGSEVGVSAIIAYFGGVWLYNKLNKSD